MRNIVKVAIGVGVAAIVGGAGPAAAIAPDERVQAAGEVAPGEEEFTTFHLNARETSGEDQGRATFTDVAVAGGRLVMDITCLRVVESLDTEGRTRRVAILTGPVVFAESGVGIGRPGIVGVDDGDQSTPLLQPDAINIDFALDMPPQVTCENAGLSIETELVRGHVTIR